MKSITRREALTGIGIFAGAILLPGCAINPVTGKREFMLMSESQEIDMGREAHGQIVAEYGLYDDSTIQKWFEERGMEMSKITQRKRLPWKFTVLDSPVINAFAVPGGFVYVTRGILGYFNNEAQFAGVLGHELGHVNARHTAERYSKAQLANIGLALGSIFSEEFNRFSELASLGTTLLFLKFSRDDERMADRLGVEYSSAVSYDAVQMSEFFNTLERMRPKGGSLPAWQSTHPDPGDRINATRKMALAYQQSHSNMTFSTKTEEYLDLIDGIIYGDDPRQGYVKDNIFYHPEMKFQFPVPAGWTLLNQPTEVKMSPEKQNSLLIFTLAPGSSPAEAATLFTRNNNVKVVSSGNISINNMSSVKTVGEITSKEQTVGIVSYFIMTDDRVLAFHGLADPSELNSYDIQFWTSASGFKRITDKTKISVNPQKITVHRVAQKTTLQRALISFGVQEKELNNLAIINGLELSDEINAGARLKIIA